MSGLSTNHCEPCRGGTLLATETEIQWYQLEVPAWEIVVIDGISRLSRTFKFKNFLQALDFTNQVGAIAEAEQHHPELLIEWGRVRVRWWTHKIGGLHRNDFIMAARTDELSLF